MDSEILIPIRLVSTSYVNAVVIVCTVLLGLSYIAVALRLWTRVMIINSVGVDDITIVPALVRSALKISSVRRITDGFRCSLLVMA